MVEQGQEHGPLTRRRGNNLGPAVAYYGLVGLIGAALTAWFVISTIEALLGGYCDPGAEFLCHYLPDLIAPTIAFVVGVTLLSTAWRIRRDPPRLGPLVSVGAVVGVAVAVLPIPLVLAAAYSSSLASGGSGSDEIDIFGAKIPTAVLVVLSAGPLLWAVHSAVMVRRESARGPGGVAKE